MKPSSIILLSGGLDSSVNLYKAHQETSIRLVLTFKYGQKAQNKEVEMSTRVCELLGLQHKVVELPWLREITRTSLVNPNEEVPTGDQVNINSQVLSEETAKKVWVPNRNGVFLNIAGAFADAYSCEFVIPGFNKEEAATFPDNSKEYMISLDRSFSYSTQNAVKVHCYTESLSKTEIVKLGKQLGVDFDLIWPCYYGESQPCGKCESCLRYKRAVQEA